MIGVNYKIASKTARGMVETKANRVVLCPAKGLQGENKATGMEKLH